MTLSEELLWRGFVQDSTFIDLRQLDQQKWTFYHGFDASADSQTIGNLAAMMLDRLFLRHGHEAILLAGGATSLIGDPGGKDKERLIQDEKTIAHNISRAEEQIKHILDGYKFKMVNNLDWMKDVKLLPFLRDVGKHFGMTPLVQRDYIAQRIGPKGAGVSYTEFSYTILQGYDYLYLYDKYGCTLQLGGSDQWGNCLSGVELIRKTRGADTHVITMPLVVNKATGKKFGKSEEGAIWLDDQKTSVFKFYQFWLNIDDEGVEDYLKIFTELDKSKIDLAMAEFNANRSRRMAQRILAYEVTKLVHGKKRADEVDKTTKVLFGEGDFLDLGKNEMHILKQELPVVKEEGDLPQILVNAGLASSKGEARNFLKAGAISINRQKAGPENLDLFVRGNNLLKRGKNNFAIVEKK
jgi:tyrosyl-tRNA synthetase